MILKAPFCFANILATISQHNLDWNYCPIAPVAVLWFHLHQKLWPKKGFKIFNKNVAHKIFTQKNVTRLSRKCLINEISNNIDDNAANCLVKLS